VNKPELLASRHVRVFEATKETYPSGHVKTVRIVLLSPWQFSDAKSWQEFTSWTAALKAIRGARNPVAAKHIVPAPESLLTGLDTSVGVDLTPTAVMVRLALAATIADEEAYLVRTPAVRQYWRGYAAALNDAILVLRGLKPASIAFDEPVNKG
jgi:hypothetical protein